ncbi:hypothetical protein Syun_001728 [Stephania yunnanensis]|uniref:Uncharacterized protein n=1 Tax=Stephania yunnanensis TaxID=152371 RepID=A0AAP0LEC0_9MAGN
MSSKEYLLSLSFLSSSLRATAAASSRHAIHCAAAADLSLARCRLAIRAAVVVC